MSLPGIYQYFNAEGQVVRQAGTSYFGPKPANGNEAKNEAMVALFKIASAVEKGRLPLERAQQIVGVVIEAMYEDEKFTLDDLAEHAKAEQPKVCTRGYIKSEFLPVLAKVFPQFG